mgnify:CR=1 FL=1
MPPAAPAVLDRLLASPELVRHASRAVLALVNTGEAVRRVGRAVIDGEAIAWLREEQAGVDMHAVGALTPLDLDGTRKALRVPAKLAMLLDILDIGVYAGRIAAHLEEHLFRRGRLDEDYLRARGQALAAAAYSFAAEEEHDGALVAPARYNREGEREAIDLIRDLLGDEAFAGFCFAQVAKYRYRRGAKGTEAENTAKVHFYRQLGLHVQSGGAIPDPREDRGEAFVPYARQPFPHGLYGLARDPDMGATVLLGDTDVVRRAPFPSYDEPPEIGMDCRGATNVGMEKLPAGAVLSDGETTWDVFDGGLCAVRESGGQPFPCWQIVRRHGGLRRIA